MSQSSFLDDEDLKDVGRPKVSIVIPAYNHEDYISECIYSVLEQDYRNIDLIVINDGSSDRTDEKIRMILAECSSRFLYISSKENNGLIKTLNVGLKQAQGKYFCEVASDDMLLPGSLSRRVDYLEAHPDIDVVFGDAYYIFDKVKTSQLLYGDKTKYNSAEHTVKDLIMGKAKMFMPSGMFRKSILDILGGFDEDFRYFEDVALWYHLAIVGNIGYMREPVMFYRVHSNNTSSSASFKLEVRREKILSLEKLLPFSHTVDGADKLAERYLCKEYRKFLRFALNNQVDREELDSVGRKAVRLAPYDLKTCYYLLRLWMKKYFSR